MFGLHTALLQEARGNRVLRVSTTCVSACVRMDVVFMRECNTAIPSPLLLVCLGVLGLALWGGMGEECADFYWYYTKACVQSVCRWARPVCTSYAGFSCVCACRASPSPLPLLDACTVFYAG